MYIWSVRHIPAPVGEVFGYAVDPWRLERWHGLVVRVDSTEWLDHAGARLDAVVRIGDGRMRTQWTVERRRRWSLHLRADDAARGSARMLLSFSPWDGGCAVELGLSCDEGYAQRRPSRARKALDRRRLSRSLVVLSRLVAAGDADRAPVDAEADLPRPAVPMVHLAGGR